jgi:hypothetical protein
MDVEAMPTTKVRPEAIFGDPVAVVATTFPPKTMLTLPMLCALAFPNVSPIEP